MDLNPVIGVLDKRSKVTIVLPFDKNGDPAFDETGNPVGGREPLTIVLPRFDFIARKDLKPVMDAIDAMSQAKKGESAFEQYERNMNGILATLKPFIAADIYQLLEQQPMGVIQQVSNDWNEASSIPLGSLRNSTASSPSMKAPSTTTSSGTDSDSAT